jgi:putative ABC transport system substrate-binding protein
MKRRALLLAGGGCAVLAAASAGAQAPTPPRRIAWLSPATPESSKPGIDAFKQGLGESGYFEGRDYAIEARWSAGDPAQLAALARELVARNPDVIVTGTSSGALALKAATRSQPVVFVGVAAPETIGVVASLARPGGNMTGIAYLGGELIGKLLGLLREIVPSARRIAVIDVAAEPVADRLRAALASRMAKLSMEPEWFPVERVEDFAPAFARMRGIDAVYVHPFALLTVHAAAIGELARKARLPMTGPSRLVAQAGGLFSYDNDLPGDYRRAASYVDRIFKGAKPADLPVEQPLRFQLVLNMKAAAALGIRIPQSVRLQATEVIE